MSAAPIACTLDPGRLHARLARIDALAAEALGRQRVLGGVRFRFRATPATERRLRELVLAESRCCAFLSFALEREGDDLCLDVTG